MNLVARRRAKRRGVHGQLPTAGIHKPCTASRRYLFGTHMIDALEKRLIEALKSVDAHGESRPLTSTIR